MTDTLSLTTRLLVLWLRPRDTYNVSEARMVNSVTSLSRVASGIAEHAQAAGDRPFSAQWGAPGEDHASPGKEAQPGTNHRSKRGNLCFRATVEAHIACPAKRGDLGKVHARNAKPLISPTLGIRVAYA